MEKTIFYLSIGGLIIKITVHPHKKLHYSEGFIDGCLKHFKKFLLDKENKPEKIDFEIVVEDEIDFYKDKKNDFFHTLIFKRISEKKIITYTHISFIHFEWMLEQLVYELVAKNDGFVFHGSAVKKDNKVYIFTAEDGGGKSTAMMMLKDYLVPVADDSGIIRKIDQEYLFFPSPFRSAYFNQLTIESKGCQIDKIFILKKEVFFKTKKVKNIKAVPLLFNEVVFDKRFSKKTMNNFLRFLKKFNDFYLLYFKKEKDEFIKFLNNYCLKRKNLTKK